MKSRRFQRRFRSSAADPTDGEPVAGGPVNGDPTEDDPAEGEPVAEELAHSNATEGEDA